MPTLCFVVRVNLSRFPVGTRLVLKIYLSQYLLWTPRRLCPFLSLWETFMSLIALPPHHLDSVRKPGH